MLTFSHRCNTEKTLLYTAVGPLVSVYEEGGLLSFTDLSGAAGVVVVEK